LGNNGGEKDKRERGNGGRGEAEEMLRMNVTRYRGSGGNSAQKQNGKLGPQKGHLT